VSDYRKPLPRTTPDTQPFWDALRRHQILLPCCRDCGEPHYPAGPVCPFCFSDSLEWRQASGRGVVSSWVVVHQKWFPAFEEDTPYNVVQVELEEGPRLTANLVEASNERLEIGLPVEIVYDDVTPEVTLPRFRPRHT